jgi:hypothetical protein
MANQIYTKVKTEKDTWSPLQTILQKLAIDMTRLFPPNTRKIDPTPPQLRKSG